MATSVDRILNFDKDQDDYYRTLGCDETATVEQINAEYKIRALQFHPDKNGGDNEAQEKFQKLNEAKETLCDPEQRKSYDKWRNSGISISYKNWKNMKDHVHQSMHWAKLNTKDRMLTENAGTSNQFLDAASNVSRRASEGGANVYCKPKTGFKWEKQSTSEVISKFRNYEI